MRISLFADIIHFLDAKGCISKHIFVQLRLTIRSKNIKNNSKIIRCLQFYATFFDVFLHWLPSLALVGSTGKCGGAKQRWFSSSYFNFYAKSTHKNMWFGAKISTNKISTDQNINGQN